MEYGGVCSSEGEDACRKGANSAYLAAEYKKSMNGEVNRADKSRYTEQVNSGVLTTASLRGRKRISRHLRMSRNKWEGDNEKTKQINADVKWQQSLGITAKRLLFSLSLKKAQEMEGKIGPLVSEGRREQLPLVGYRSCNLDLCYGRGGRI